MSLEGWQNGVPNYTPEEKDAIQRKLSLFQSSFNQRAGGEVVFHPEAVGHIQRMLTAEALYDLAGERWRWSSKIELPQDWKDRVSTYLKAWACDLNPDAFCEMAELLA
ncbi:MAG: hypothetical protein P8Z30_10195, partial [Acidobacteriota bacterium]